MQIQLHCKVVLIPFCLCYYYFYYIALNDAETCQACYSTILLMPFSKVQTCPRFQIWPTMVIHTLTTKRQKAVVLYLCVCSSGVSGRCLLVPARTVRTGHSCWVQLFPLPSNGKHRLHSSPKIKPWVRYSECTLSCDGAERSVSEALGWGVIQVTLDMTKSPPYLCHQIPHPR